MREAKMDRSDGILHRYRYALRLLYGNEAADKSELYYSHGWYYVNLARTFPDGSVGTIGVSSGRRAKQIEQMTKELLRRFQMKETTQSRKRRHVTGSQSQGESK